MLGIGGAAMPLRALAAAPYWVVDEAFEHGVAEMTADKTQLTLKVGTSGLFISYPVLMGYCRLLYCRLLCWGVTLHLRHAVADGNRGSRKV
jgi:hypothetical protein